MSGENWKGRGFSRCVLVTPKIQPIVRFLPLTAKVQSAKKQFPRGHEVIDPLEPDKIGHLRSSLYDRQVEFEIIQDKIETLSEELKDHLEERETFENTYFECVSLSKGYLAQVASPGASTSPEGQVREVTVEVNAANTE
ncbi:hypothetical protein JYU34_022606 [Plutella xylostella]|uniref:Uncharacterized protein n=1 Tax=Plutella xylostella TaxID=51655 RepID=A0ABQ7PRH9_PLUXY|nr:hypothetical protein JYU34_022606 [Plutella xylostella]